MSDWIAVASGDGVTLDLAWEKSIRFDIYSLMEDGSVSFVESRGLEQRMETIDLDTQIEQLADCQAVFCKSIAFEARKRLKERGLWVFEVQGRLDEVLSRCAPYLTRAHNPLHQVISRIGTDSLKFDFIQERKGRNDLLPLWVADMDFALPTEITTALAQRVLHGIFGYTETKEDYRSQLVSWYEHHHGWKVEGAWNTITPGVVYGIAQAIRAYTKPGDAVLIQQPVYYPFSEVILDNDRRLINNELVFDGAKYRIDFEDFERKIVEEDVKLFLLCNPHNPVGRVWTKEELQRIEEITSKHQVLVFADEIHGDFTYPGYTYIPFASLSEVAASHTIVGTSASKTFNIAGLQVSNIIIPNPTLRRQFCKQVAADGYSQGNTMGLLATKLCYDLGAWWLEAVRRYLTSNLDVLRQYLTTNLPQIQLVEPEGTYLVWLDFEGLGLTAEEVERLVVDEAHLFLDSGAIFGDKSKYFQRINIACPQETLLQALQQLYDAIEARKL